MRRRSNRLLATRDGERGTARELLTFLIAFLAAFFLTLFLVPRRGLALSSPHDAGPGIGCEDCHALHGGGMFDAVTDPHAGGAMADNLWLIRADVDSYAVGTTTPAEKPAVCGWFATGTSASSGNGATTVARAMTSDRWAWPDAWR